MEVPQSDLLGWWCSGDSGCESRAAQEVPGVSAVRRSLIVANCLTRSAAQAGLGTGPTLKNRGPSVFSTSSISRRLFERHDGISVPMAVQPVRLP
jgi:hypothetical protein